jgi:hypothetical protein
MIGLSDFVPVYYIIKTARVLLSQLICFFGLMKQYKRVKWRTDSTEERMEK